jgi:hypothetical protein
MIHNLRSKLLLCTLDHMRRVQRTGGGDLAALRPPWRVAACLGDDEGSRIFATRLCEEFGVAARDISRVASAAHAFRIVGSGGPGTGSGGSSAGGGGGGSAGGAGDEQPYIASVFELLGLAAEWIGRVMAEVDVEGTPIPNKARSAVVIALHGYVSLSLSSLSLSLCVSLSLYLCPFSGLPLFHASASVSCARACLRLFLSLRLLLSPSLPVSVPHVPL